MERSGRPKWLTGHETVRYEAFQKIEAKFEDLSARSEQQEAEISKLKVEVSNLKKTHQATEISAKSTREQLRGPQLTFGPNVTAQKSQPELGKGQPALKSSATFQKPKDKPEDDEGDDCIVVATRPLPPHISSTPPKAIKQPPQGTSISRAPIGGSAYLLNNPIPRTPQPHMNEPSVIVEGLHLKFIRDTDFSSDRILLIPSFKIRESKESIFVDVKLDENNDPKLTHKYFVSMGESQAHLGMGYRLPSWAHGRYRGVHNHINQKVAFEGSVLELKTKIGDASTSDRDRNRQVTVDRSKSRRIEQPAPPRYVHEIGELFISSHSHQSGQVEPSRSTSCHVVTDACSEKKPLWLIYRYKGVNKGGQVVKRRQRFDRDDDMFGFVKGDQGFDLCQLAKSMDDWLNEDCTFKDVRNAQGLIKSTRCRADPELVTPVYEEFLEELTKMSASDSRT